MGVQAGRYWNSWLALVGFNFTFRGTIDQAVFKIDMSALRVFFEFQSQYRPGTSPGVDGYQNETGKMFRAGIVVSRAHQVSNFFDG